MFLWGYSAAHDWAGRTRLHRVQKEERATQEHIVLNNTQFEPFAEFLTFFPAKS